MSDDLQIEWSKHAIKRVAERFGFDDRIKIPNDRIKKLSERNPHHKEFHVRSGKVHYVCIRRRNVITIATVFKKKGRAKKARLCLK